MSTTADTVPIVLPCFETHRSGNWLVDESPTLLLNPAASLHKRIAWSWGIAAQVEDLTCLLLSHTEPDLRKLATYVNGQMMMLAQMLELIGDETAAQARKEGAT